MVDKNNIVDYNHVTKVSDSTGEIITYVEPVYAEDTLQKEHEKSLKFKSIKETHAMLREKYGSFFFYFYKKLDEYDIKPQYKLRFLYLASYLDYDNGEVINRGQCNVKYRIDRMKLKEILKLKDTEFRTTLKNLTECGLLVKDGDFFKLNTDCVNKGEIPSKSVYYTRVFVKSIKDLYDKCDSKGHKPLYYIFKILPLVNVQYNMPCKNIHCECLNEIQGLTVKEIALELGYDPTSTNKLWKIFRGFRINGDYIFCKHVLDDDKEYITINPRVYYAGTRIDELKYVINIFDMAKQ